MTQSNVSLYVDENTNLLVRHGPIPEPSDGEILIQTSYSGINPADVKHATQLGIYPAVMGYDFCGKVIKTTPSSQFTIGDCIAGYTPTGLGRPEKYGTHQSYLVCREDMVFRVPGHLPEHHAACLAVVAMTAADGLYNLVRLPLPTEGKANSGLLIWGASSSVGVCAVQFASASGVFPIIVTASPGRHDMLKRLGATHCFDYKSPSIVSDIQTVTGNGPIAHAFDTVGGPGSAESMADCVSDTTSLLSVVVQRDPRFKMPLATTQDGVSLRIQGVPHPITIPARPDDAKRAWKAFQWAVGHYGQQFELPVVELFEGRAEDALRELEASAEGRGFGKLVLRHPLK
ncbi:hypothetical protein ASPWEDRAFT_174152 [Aspergillus wentii DTO 134E9]|uniref:Enoyl reductase (ER) domain-containing protein n=1 Tax=Aspergillus wentii DTO 134E9 TaxID=1073089 RepID=A0A1L9RCQ2_ASPWE|nr:uncharacterized protein ASPWEDRAFT_174152 [Aspergillus wentii DTO 134E9]KAI9924285.1 hypothetical protein MW887_007235 [Aspergillus wentii]OJJ32705.1 hypothetical protein ASPWEDRAFT_174152 [Aspergillus wentii DTO 134E9]